METYAWHKMAKGDISWLPVRNSLALQESNIVLGGEEDDAKSRQAKLVSRIVQEVGSL